MQTPPSRWILFHVALVVLLAVEFAFSRLRRPRAPEALARRQHRNALAATALWIAASLAFAFYLDRALGHSFAVQFLAGYALEQSLSIDNLFVFLLLFSSFRIEPARQPRVLFWGVLGAIVLRGLFILGGLSLLDRFHWVGYVFALILLVAALRLVLPHDAQTVAKPPVWLAWINRIHPVSATQKTFFVLEQGRPTVTMLFLALLAIEFTDVLFALDSIPAVLSITRVPFLAYTSNILAVIGLRSLFFLLAAALRRLPLLHFGLAAILAFAAVKILLSSRYEIPPIPSLLVIVGLLGLTVAASLLAPAKTPGAL